MPQWKVITETEPQFAVPVVGESEISMIDILKTVTWREVLDMLLGIIAIGCFIVGLVFAFGA